MRLVDAQRWFERSFVPDEVGDDAQGYRRWSLVMHSSALVSLVGTAFSLLYAVLGLWISSAAVFVPVLAAAFILFVPRARVKPQMLGTLLTSTVFVAFVGGALQTGGLMSPALMWFPAAVTAGYFVAGRSQGVLAAVGGVLPVGTLSVMYVSGVVVPGPALGDAFMRVFTVVTAASVLFSTCAVMWMYEAGRARAVRRVEELQDGTRCLLDSVTDGLLMVSVSGRIHPQHSLATETLLPGVGTAKSLRDALMPHDAETAEWVQLGWDELADGLMPYAVILDQLPSLTTVQGRSLRLTYSPILESDQLRHVLIVISDITADLAAARAQDDQKEMLAFFMKRIEHPVGVRDFLAEVRMLIDNLSAGGSAVELGRWIHTLKGSVGTFGLASFARYLHEAEDAIEREGECSDDLRHAIVQHWTTLAESLAPIMGDDESTVGVDMDSLERLIVQARAGTPSAVLADTLERWAWEDVGYRLDQLAERGSQVADRLGKRNVRFVVESNAVAVPPSQLHLGFWAALVHVVRNAVDHGVEPEDERHASGKEPVAEIRLSAALNRGRMVVCVSDDGRGIQWDKLRTRAQSLGLPCETEDDLVELLFHDGVTTVEAVSDVSGRGIGMAALRDEVLRSNGRVCVESSPGEGTKFLFELPIGQVQALSVAS